MSKREEAVVRAFIDRANLPTGAFTVLPVGHGSALQLHVWLDHSFMHAVKGLPNEVHGVPIILEAKPLLRAYVNSHSR